MRKEDRLEDSEQKLEVWIGCGPFSSCIFIQVCWVMRAVRTMDATVDPVDEHFVRPTVRRQWLSNSRSEP